MLDKTVAITADRVRATGGRPDQRGALGMRPKRLAERIRQSNGDLLLIRARRRSPTARTCCRRRSGGRRRDRAFRHAGRSRQPAAAGAGRRRRRCWGCRAAARSPKLNGFDWVLQRIAAGIDGHDARDIMRMGVGGLLVEIPTPAAAARRQRRPSPGPRIAALVLAAGHRGAWASATSCWPKSTAGPMVAHVVDALLASRAAPVIVVTGRTRADQVRPRSASGRSTWSPIRIMPRGSAPRSRLGLPPCPMTSTACCRCSATCRASASAQVDRLIAGFDPLEGRAIVVPTVRGKRGNPDCRQDGFFVPKESPS